MDSLADAAAALDSDLAAEEPAEIFRELLRHWPQAQVEDYFQNGAWLKDVMLLDVALIKAPNAKPHPNFIKMSFVTYSVGSQCEALWAEDGQFYPAEVLSVFRRKDAEMCRVKFLEYDDEAEVLASDLKPLAKPQRAQKQANGKPTSASASPAPRLQSASTPPASSSVASNGASATTPKVSGSKTPKASPAATAASSDLDSELKLLQAELRAKEEEDKHEKEAALAEMKALADKLLLEGFARQSALVELQAREDRLKQQLALLSKNFASFASQSHSSSPHAAAASSPAAAANHDVADVARCVEGIKGIQAKFHGGANEAVLVSQLGLAINPKVDGLKQFLTSFPQHFEVLVKDSPSFKSKSSVASVRLR